MADTICDSFGGMEEPVSLEIQNQRLKKQVQEYESLMNNYPNSFLSILRSKTILQKAIDVIDEGQRGDYLYHLLTSVKRGQNMSRNL